MSKIKLTLEGSFAAIRAPFMGDAWKDFRLCIEGAIFNKAKKCNYATLDKVPGILVRLREADFAVECSGDLTRALAEHTSQLWNDVQSAKERAKLFDVEMQKRINPRTGKPYYMYPFQYSGITWLTMKHGALLADDMGTGKTLQTIAAFPANAAVLVVGPAVAKGVWKRELAAWRPGLRVSMLEGRGNFRWPKPGEVILTNYEILPDTHTAACLADRKSKDKIPGKHDAACLKAQGNLFVPALQMLAQQCKGCLKRSSVAKDCTGCVPFLNECPKDVVIVFDEAHNLKNGNAQRTVRGRGLATAVRKQGGRVWLLTATPLLNHPIELWSIFQAALLAQEVFGDFKTFLRLFDAKEASEHGGYLFGTPDSEEIAERMQRVMLRRMKRDVLQDLPPKDWATLTVEIDPKTLKACDRFVGEHGGMESIEKTLGKSLSFETMSVVAKALAIAKIPAMLDFVADYEAQEEPLVVFSAHRAPIDELEKRPGWAVITGDTPPENRSKIEARFQAGELKGLGCTIRAGGVALTLTRSAYGLFVDREWSPKINEQAEDRLLRIGQDRPVLITTLVADHPLDARVTELTTAKTVLIDASVDAAREQIAEGAAQGRDHAEVNKTHLKVAST